MHLLEVVIWIALVLPVMAGCVEHWCMIHSVREAMKKV